MRAASPSTVLGSLSQLARLSRAGSKWNLEVGYQLYNALFTLFPILWIGITDKDLTDEHSRVLPQVDTPQCAFCT